MLFTSGSPEDSFYERESEWGPELNIHRFRRSRREGATWPRMFRQWRRRFSPFRSSCSGSYHALRICVSFVSENCSRRGNVIATERQRCGNAANVAQALVGCSWRSFLAWNLSGQLFRGADMEKINEDDY